MENQKYSWVETYCLSKPGVKKDFKEEWNAYRYLIDDKMFLMHGGDKEEREIFTVKLQPEFGDMLRREHKGEIVPGYYMNKTHWNSVYTENETVTDALLKEMLDMSYDLILKSLSKKRQKEILEQ